jgi:XTP/dITP diphosphohydrolase
MYKSATQEKRNTYSSVRQKNNPVINFIAGFFVTSCSISWHRLLRRTFERLNINLAEAFNSELLRNRSSVVLLLSFYLSVYLICLQTMNKTTLIFATNNQHKVDEIRSVIGDRLNIITMKEAGIDIDIPEPYDTLEANAREKSTTIHKRTGSNCFSEDTGLEVEVLNGEPGVKSARYAGETRNFQANIDKLLLKLEGKENRTARFRTVISLIWNNKEYLFEGVSEGHIIAEQKGTEGFGYDPVFVPVGSSKTFAEMSLEEKNMYSHRRKATDKLIAFLQNQS